MQHEQELEKMQTAGARFSKEACVGLEHFYSVGLLQ